MNSKREWLRIVRKFLCGGGRWRVTEDHSDGSRVYYFITRNRLLIRETWEVIDPEVFAREHISAAVIPIHGGITTTEQ